MRPLTSLRWADEQTFNKGFPNLFDATLKKNMTVHKAFNFFSKKWCLNFFGPLTLQTHDELEELYAHSNHMAPNNEHVRELWRWKSSTIHSVTSCYKILSFGGIVDDTAKFVWQSCTTLRTKVFRWLLYRNKILTTENLAKRNWLQP